MNTTAVHRVTIGFAVFLMLLIAAFVLLGPVREHFNRWKCATNLSAIGQITLLYAHDHEGNFPPDLGTLAMEEDAAAVVFTCPDSGASAPHNLPPTQLVAWVNAHSDYIYLGRRLKDVSSFDSKTNELTVAFEDEANPGTRWNSTQAGQLVVAYEKEQDHGRAGMNVLFADGHVDWMTIDAAHRVIALSSARTTTTRESAPSSRPSKPLAGLKQD